MFGYRAGAHAVGLCRARDRDVRLLCPHGGDLPRRVRLVPERARDAVVPDVRVCPRGVRATSLSSCITCCPGPHTSTEGSLRLRLVSTVY
jgi:hypothetical protein